MCPASCMEVGAHGAGEDAGGEEEAPSGGSRQGNSSRLSANGGQEAATQHMCLQGSRLSPSRAHASVRLTLKTSPEMKQRLQDSYTNNQTSDKTKPQRKAKESAELWGS